MKRRFCTKNKVNYKYPGGADYAAHQDAVAYAYVDRHVTCLLAVDPMTPDNGCLEFVAGGLERVLERDETGFIKAGVADGLTWAPVR